MKATKLILTAIIVILNITIGQSIESIRLIPDQPNERDTVKIIVASYFTSSPCYLKHSNVTLVEDTIQVDAIYMLGYATTPCFTLDTIPIGVFKKGKYKLVVSEYELSGIDTNLVDTDAWHFTIARDPEKAFINLSKVWLMNKHNYDLGADLYNHLYYVKIGDESVVDGKHYRKVLRTPDTDQLNWELFGFIRETLDRKVYFRRYRPQFPQIGVDKERLLFDFNAEQGDTLRNLYTRYIKPHRAVVTNVDSVQLMNDKAKKLTLFIEPHDTMEWVEKIGDYKGGIIPNPWVREDSDEYTMTCCFDHGDLLFHRPVLEYGGEENGNTIFDTVDVACRYPRPKYTDTIRYIDTIRYVDTIPWYDTLKVTLLDTVSLSTNNIDLAADLTAKIYPIPARHGLNIELSQPVNELSYRLINSEGVVLKSGDMYNNAEKLEVDVSGLPPGTYFIQLLYNNHKKTFKVMIQ